MNWRKIKKMPVGTGKTGLRASSLGLLVLSAFWLSSCGPYRLGTTLPDHLRTVYVPTFENETYEPGIEMDITDAVITRFRQDGNLRPVGEEEADTVVTGKIIAWDRRVLGYTGRDESDVEEYRLYVNAVITFRDRATGEDLFRGQEVQGYTDFYLEGDLPSAEEAARPRAYQDLARNIVDVVVSIW
jgi:hypothetical protein